MAQQGLLFSNSMPNPEFIYANDLLPGLLYCTSIFGTIFTMGMKSEGIPRPFPLRKVEGRESCPAVDARTDRTDSACCRAVLFNFLINFSPNPNFSDSLRRQ